LKASQQKETENVEKKAKQKNPSRSSYQRRYAKESLEQKEKRLKDQKERQKRRRKNESDVERLNRLEKDKFYKRIRRQNELARIARFEKNHPKLEDDSTNPKPNKQKENEYKGK
jgi:hypothetical protein